MLVTREIALDTSQWPVVLIQVPEGSVSDEMLSDFLERLRMLLKNRPGYYAFVMDLRHHAGLTPKQRKMIVRGMGRDTPERRRCVGNAMVFTSTVLRGMLTAILWMKQSSHETRVFSTVEEAAAWAGRQVEQAEETSFGLG